MEVLKVLNLELRDFELAKPKSEKDSATSRQVSYGKVITPRQHLLLFSAEEWEFFLEEWGTFQKSKYRLVTRLGGANDFGVDVACFNTEYGFSGDWENYQCKYYKGDPLAPGTAIPEIGKLLWHVYKGNLTKPKKYYFFSPKDCGPSLKKLLLNSEKLKTKLFEEWYNWCAGSITTEVIPLEGNFKDFVSSFDFDIFKYKPVNEVIEEYRETPYYSIRFGGGLKTRPEPLQPPSTHQKNETRYIEQLHNTYAQSKGVKIQEFQIDKFPDLQKHLFRQRESFYFAESLRTFARDSVPLGTFEELQNDMLDGVIDTAEDNHENGLIKLTAVLRESKSVPLDANGLFETIRVKDRYGICHQLANDDRLKWLEDDE
jgi:hypothetical protein